MKVASYLNGAPSDSLSHSIPPTSTHLLICIRHGVLRFAVYLLAGAYIIAWLEGGSDFFTISCVGDLLHIFSRGHKHFFRLDVRRLLVRNGQPCNLACFGFFFFLLFLSFSALLFSHNSFCWGVRTQAVREASITGQPPQNHLDSSTATLPRGFKRRRSVFSFFLGYGVVRRNFSLQFVLPGFAFHDEMTLFLFCGKDPCLCFYFIEFKPH